MPNAWDVGSARILASLGFQAIATTSSGHAASLGRMDQRVTLEELLAHVSALVDAVDVPVSVDAERCFADDADGVAVTVERIAKQVLPGYRSRTTSLAPGSTRSMSQRNGWPPQRR